MLELLTCDELVDLAERFDVEVADGLVEDQPIEALAAVAFPRA